MFEQRNGGIQQFLTKSQQPVTDGAEITFDVASVHLQPFAPALHGLLAGVIFRVHIVWLDDSIQNTGDDLRQVVFVRCKQIRQFTVQ